MIQGSLTTSEAMLEQQNVQFIFVRQDGVVIYPLTTDQPIDIPFENYWKGLQEGQRQQETTKQDI